MPSPKIAKMDQLLEETSNKNNGLADFGVLGPSILGHRLGDSFLASKKRTKKVCPNFSGPMDPRR